MAESVSFKITFKSEKVGEPEVRRFLLDNEKSKDFDFLQQKIISIFPVLKNKLISITWTDNDGDHVTISNNEDLMIALNEMTGTLLKLNIKSMGEKLTSTHELHPGVTCDGCEGSVAGTRFKCLVCQDYDLCQNCEDKKLHNNHVMMRIVSPQGSCRQFLCNLAKKQKLQEQMEARNKIKEKIRGRNSNEENKNVCWIATPMGLIRVEGCKDGSGNTEVDETKKMPSKLTSGGPNSKITQNLKEKIENGKNKETITTGEYWIATPWGPIRVEVCKEGTGKTEEVKETGSVPTGMMTGGQNPKMMGTPKENIEERSCTEENVGKYWIVTPWGSIRVEGSKKRIDNPGEVKENENLNPKKIETCKSACQCKDSTEGREAQKDNKAANNALKEMLMHLLSPLNLDLNVYVDVPEDESATHNSSSTMNQEEKQVSSSLEERNSSDSEAGTDPTAENNPEHSAKTAEDDEVKSNQNPNSEDEKENDWTILNNVRVLYVDPVGRIYPNLPEQTNKAAKTTAPTPTTTTASATPASSPSPTPASTPSPASALNSSPDADQKIQIALEAMMNMGFRNEGGWLTSLLKAKNGDIGSVLQVLQPVRQ